MTVPPDAVPVDYSAEPNKDTILATLTTLVPMTPSTTPLTTWADYMMILADVTFVDRRLLFEAQHNPKTLFLASDGGAANR
jgi:hypothetical protein